jgi:hypothetical protein
MLTLGSGRPMVMVCASVSIFALVAQIDVSVGPYWFQTELLCQEDSETQGEHLTPHNGLHLRIAFPSLFEQQTIHSGRAEHHCSA